MKYYYQIESYIEGNLEGEELQAFEKALENDPDLRLAVDNYPLSTLTLDTLYVKEGRNYLDNVALRTNRIRKFRRVTAIAASIAVILLASLTWYANTSLSNTQLAAAYAIESTRLPQVRGEEEMSDNKLIDQVRVAFNNSEYEQVLKLIPALPDTLQSRQSIQIASAVSLVEVGSFENAIPKLQTLTQDAGTHKDFAEWYLVECYLQLDMLVDAKELLQDMSNNEEHTFQDKARELLSRLDDPLRKLLF